MMIDNEIRLSGHGAIEFKNMMETADMSSIMLRDEFVHGISSSVDSEGTLFINCPELNIDLSCLNDKSKMIETTIILVDEENYVDKVSVQVGYACLSGKSHNTWKDDTYKKEIHYTRLTMNCLNQKEAIRYAA